MRALQRGCRCIELDVWDGPSGIPLVYHGRTLTNRLSLVDVAETIAKYAFAASSFPLILSLEVRCSTEQQDNMADLFKKVFGDALVISRQDQENSLPSPESLRGRILLKGKVTTTPRNSDAETEEEISPTEANLSKRHSWKTLAAAALPDFTTNKEPKVAAKKKSAISHKLVELIVYCKKIHFEGFPVSDHHFDQMFSFSEKRSNSLLQKNEKEYKDYNTRYLTRVYPSGIRVNSSNVDPLPHWLCGAQLVAMNYQTYGKSSLQN